MGYYNYWNDVYENCYPLSELSTNSDVCTTSNCDVQLSKCTKVPKAKHPEVVKTVSKAKVSDRTDCPVITQAHSSTPQLIDIQYWIDKQEELANCRSFKDVKSVVNRITEDHHMKIQNNGVHASGNFTIDPIALCVYPRDAPQLMKPVKCYGDGNCFMRSVSKLVFGTEAHHLAV